MSSNEPSPSRRGCPWRAGFTSADPVCAGPGASWRPFSPLLPSVRLRDPPGPASDGIASASLRRPHPVRRAGGGRNLQLDLALHRDAGDAAPSFWRPPGPPCRCSCLRLFLPDRFRCWRVPLSVILIDTILAFGGVLALRILRRALYERARRTRAARRSSGNRRPALLVGAGRAGVLAAREISGRGRHGPRRQGLRGRRSGQTAGR